MNPSNLCLDWKTSINFDAMAILKILKNEQILLIQRYLNSLKVSSR